MDHYDTFLYFMTLWLILAYQIRFFTQTLDECNEKGSRKRLRVAAVLEYLGNDGLVNCVALRKGLRDLIRVEDAYSVREYVPIYLDNCVKKSSRKNERRMLSEFLEKHGFPMENGTERQTRMNTESNRTIVFEDDSNIDMKNMESLKLMDFNFVGRVKAKRKRHVRISSNDPEIRYIEAEDPQIAEIADDQ